MIDKELEKKIKAWVERNGFNDVELYVDYNDEIPEATITELLKAKHPMQAFYDYMGYGDSDLGIGKAYYFPEAFWQEEDEIVKQCREEFQLDEDKVSDEELRDILYDYINVHADYDHFLKQEYNVDIFLTNDEEENYEYTLNCIYPQYYAGEEQRIQDINDNASLLWLAYTQGYNKHEFYNVMHYTPKAVNSKFLSSVRAELTEYYSEIAQVVFLQKRTLGDILDIAEHKLPLHIRKDTICGLHNDWSGCTSMLEIELEKDVEIPYGRYEILPAHGYKYSVDDVCGLCDCMWKAA